MCGFKLSGTYALKAARFIPHKAATSYQSKLEQSQANQLLPTCGL